MDQDIINIIIGTVLSVLGWFARQLWDAVQSLKADMQKIEISLPTHYVRKDELEQRFDKIEAMLGKISEKLDHKVDK
jgi:predicted amidophosphoribosyltransferase